MIDLNKITNIRRSYSKVETHSIEEREEFKLVREILLKYAMNTTFFDKNLSNLIIVPNTNDNSGVEGLYNARNNTIYMPKDKASFLHELFHMASNNIKTNNDIMGVLQKLGSKTIGTGYNEGITDFFTHLAFPNYKPNYPIEEKVVSILCDVYGYGIFRGYFNADAEEFYNSFGEDKKEIIEIGYLLTTYNKALFDVIDMFNNAAIDKYKINTIYKSIEEVFNKLFGLLNSKGIDTSKYNKDLREMFYGDIPNMVALKKLIESSDYVNVDNLLNNCKNGDEKKL